MNDSFLKWLWTHYFYLPRLKLHNIAIIHILISVLKTRSWFFLRILRRKLSLVITKEMSKSVWVKCTFCYWLWSFKLGDIKLDWFLTKIYLLRCNNGKTLNIGDFEFQKQFLLFLCHTSIYVKQFNYIINIMFSQTDIN